MLNSTVLEVAIGLSFAYAAVALIASSIYEAIASLVKLRARSLLSGIKAMLNDNEFTGLAKDVYNHAMVNPRDSGDARDQHNLKFLPSYIDSKHFAIALIESIERAPRDFNALQKEIAQIPNEQLKNLLSGFCQRANGSVENLRNAVAEWFDSGMARVSGAYKRNAQLFSFAIALGIAALFNIDSFHLFSTLWHHPMLVAKLSASTQDAANVVAALSELPIGWSRSAPDSALMVIVMVMGWLVTACSALFGAPFWFDTLQKLTNLRGTGPKPKDEKAQVAPHLQVRRGIQEAAE